MSKTYVLLIIFQRTNWGVETLLATKALFGKKENIVDKLAYSG